MTEPNQISYKPSKTIKEFMRWYKPRELFYAWCVGPYGSAKTTGNFFKLVRMACLQEPGPDGVKRSRCVVVRNTAPQLTDTTIKSWFYWFKDGVGGCEWQATNKTFILRLNDGSTLVECEVMFRALDSPGDVARVLSLEVTFAIVDEFVEIVRPVIEALSGRCGRFPSKKDGGATNWGMWGASNVSTEDNWWYEYFYRSSSVLHFAEQSWEDGNARQFRLQGVGLEDDPEEPPNAAYFLQPGGMARNAENLENLPPYQAGNHAYYINLRKGKTKGWIGQFIDAVWGFSADGTPVISSFEADRHIARHTLKYNPLLPLVVGLDPGVTSSAMIFTQMDLFGRLLVLGELVQQGMGAQRLIDERLKPYLRLRFPNARVIIAPDPAAANRAQTDEKSVVGIFKKHYEVKVESNNRLPLRIDSIDSFMTKSVDAGPAFLIDAHYCPALIRALKGGWRWEITKKDEPKTQVEDNPSSHPGDALGYAARFHVKKTAKEIQLHPEPGSPVQPWRPKRQWGANAYHAR
jgi:hypothetical protein